MSYLYEKETGDIVIDGWEKGIAPSPHQGLGNIQCANISTEMGEVMCNYNRIQQSQIPIVGQALNISDSSHLLNINTGQVLTNGTWIVISGSTGTPANNTYFVSNVAGTTAQTFQISLTFNGAPLSGFTGSIGSFNTINMGLPALGAKAKENYNDASNNPQTRYYIMDVNGRVWVHDTAVTAFYFGLIDTGQLTSNANAGGLAVYQGWLHAIIENLIYVKPTSALGTNGAGSTGWGTANTGNLNTLIGSKNPHTAITSSQNFLAFCDSNYIPTIVASSNSQSSTTPNIWSYGTYTFSTTTLTLTNLIGGNFVVNGQIITFFASAAGTLPTGVSAQTVYYVVNASTTTNTFSIALTVGGSAISLSGGSGIQYFNSYCPIETGAVGTLKSFIASRYNTTLPTGEIAQCLAELNLELYVGCTGKTIYIIDETNASQISSQITTQENNTTGLENINNNIYVLQGSKGNISICNGSSISPVITVPDYVTGQIEPYFTFGDKEYIRGRFYFSVTDSNSKTGGIWSFIPTQNNFIQQDVGLSLRLEEQNSYGTYAGDASIILGFQNQNARGAQYVTAWNDGNNNYGIDSSGIAPYSGGQTIIETDIMQTGTMLEKKSFAQIEYKLAAPLVNGESIAIAYRKNITDAYTPLTLSETDGGNPLAISGFFTATFEKTQWLQLKITLTSTATNPSFVRLKEIRVR